MDKEGVFVTVYMFDNEEDFKKQWAQITCDLSENSIYFEKQTSCIDCQSISNCNKDTETLKIQHLYFFYFHRNM